MKLKIIHLTDDTPSYEGYTDIFKVGDQYFRTRDAESYSSGLEEIDKKEYERLLKYEDKQHEEN